MKIFTAKKLVAKPSSSFLRAARKKGLSVKLARTLYAAAHEFFPDEPESILCEHSRFVEAALRSINHDLGKLELSFGRLEDLASAMETLDFAHGGEIPEPFRRVWVENKNKTRVLGVVLIVSDEEIAIFCPPTKEPIEDFGGAIQLSSHESSSLFPYEFVLNDAVRLPNTTVLHLKRGTGLGSIGRVNKRYDVEIVGFVRELSSDGEQTRPVPCKLLDISLGGARLSCHFDFKKETSLHLDVFLDDGISEPLSIGGTSRWSRSVPEGHHVGVQFCDISKLQSERLETAMLILKDSQGST